MSNANHHRKLYQLALSAAATAPLFAASYYIAYLLRFAGEPTPHALDIFYTTLLMVLVIKWCSFVWFRLHQSWSRFVSFDDLVVLGKSISCATLAITMCDAICLPHLSIPRSVILIDWGATLLIIGAAQAVP